MSKNLGSLVTEAEAFARQPSTYLDSWIDGATNGQHGHGCLLTLLAPILWVWSVALEPAGVTRIHKQKG